MAVLATNSRNELQLRGSMGTITGVEEVLAMMDRAPKAIVAGAFAKALDAAGKVIIAELWPRVKVNEAAATNDGHGGKGPPLVAKLDAWIEIDAAGRGGTLQVGFGSLGHIALWLEYGHERIGHKPRKRKLGFTRAYPFMRPAFDACGDRAIDAFATALAQHLQGGI